MQQIYISRDGQQRGPYTEAQIFEMVSAGVIGTQDQYWQEGCEGWRPLVEYPNLPPIRSNATPPPPPQAAATHTVIREVVKVEKRGCFSSFARLIGFAIIGLVALVVIGAMLGGKGKKGSSNFGSSSSSSIALPADQSRFLGVIQEATNAYDDAGNQLQKSSVRSDRRKKLEGAVPGRSFSNWVGVVKQMSTTSEGKASIQIEIPESDVILKTWNNELSDIGSNSLIAHGSALYQSISKLSEGDTVTFSGQFVASEQDYLKEGSLTEAGAMNDPEFIVRFSEVRASGK